MKKFAWVLMSVFVVLAGCNQTDKTKVADEKFIVMIDAGHGGIDNGVFDSLKMSLPEKEIVFQISEKIKSSNSNDKIEFLLMRDTDDYLNLAQRAEKANSLKPNLLISLHLDYLEDSTKAGNRIYYSIDNNYAGKSLDMAKVIQREFKYDFLSEFEIVKSNFLLLRTADCPALILHLGNANNSELINYLSDDKNQSETAVKLTKAIEKALLSQGEENPVSGN